MKWLIAAWCITLGTALDVAAQSYPEKPIRVIVPFAPGGGTDVFARIVGSKLTEIWGQQILVDHRPGAQGNIGTALGAKAAPDGYTITIVVTGTLAVNPHLFGKPGAVAPWDFAAVTRGTEEVWILIAHPSVPVKSAKELAAFAKKHPGKLNNAAQSPSGDLLAKLFNHTTGTNLVNIPYKGAGPAVIDLLAGNVELAFFNPPSVLPHIKVGKLRALMVMGPKRFGGLPDVPHAVEAGYPELDLTGWYGVVAPPSTPREVIVKLNAGFVRALKSPDVLERMHAAGQRASPSTPEEFAEQIRTDFERWGKVVKATGAKVE